MPTLATFFPRLPRLLAGLAAWLLVGAAMGSELSPGTRIHACDDANEWPPYTYRLPGPDGELAGFSVELLRKILTRHGLTLEIELLPWKRCLDEVRHGQRYLMLLSAARTAPRELEYWISQPYYATHTYYIWSRRQHPDGLKLRAMEDLRGLRLGNVAGYVSPTLNAMGIEPSSLALNHQNLVQMLHRGRIDAVLVAEEVLHARAAGQGPNPWDDPDIGRAPMPGAPTTRYHMFFSRAVPQGAALHRLVNAELERLQRSGELQQLLARHLTRP